MSQHHYILGTAGHVDHGKTALLKALTGIDTDRLPEEKARGLSIDLGFAHLSLPGGIQAGIVDVPGHERFLKNMLAGVGGYDLAMLVVDSQEGVMPQTREHVEILDLLRTRAGVVVLTKVDLAEPEFLDLVQEELREYLAGTFLQAAPIVRVSALTGAGLDDLKAVLARELGRLPSRDAEAPFRLPVDRVFLKPGFGTVVTGSLWSGRLRKGDRVAIMPQGLEGRVRGVQVHGSSEEEAVAGQRVAVNLAGVEPGSLHRGMVLAPPGLLVPTHRVDVRLEALPDLPRAVKHRQRVRFYAGTAEGLGRLQLLEAGEIASGAAGLAQVVLEDPVVLLRRDRFILRNSSAQFTLGGGEVLDPVAPRHRRNDPQLLATLRRRETGGAGQAVLAALERAAGGARTLGALAQELQVPPAKAESLVEELVQAGEVVRLGKHLAPAGKAQALRLRITAVLERLQEAAPWKVGWRKEELLRLLGSDSPRLAEEILADSCRRGEVVDRGGMLALRSHEARLDEQQAAVLARVEEVLRQGGFSPPDWPDVPFLAEVEPRLWKVLEAFLLETGRAVRVAPNIVYLETVLEQARGRLGEALREEGPLTASRAREVLETSRKFIIPLLEYFDQTHFTRRAGDVRHLGSA